MRCLVRILVVVLTTVAWSAIGHAQQPPTPVVAVIDVTKVMRESQASESIRSQIEQKRSLFQEEIAQREADLRTAEQDLIDQRAVLAPEIFAERQKEFQAMVAEMQRHVQNRKRQLDEAFANGMQQVERMIAQVAQEIASARGVNMVLTKSMVIYSVPALDITDETVAQLNQKLPSVSILIAE